MFQWDGGTGDRVQMEPNEGLGGEMEDDEDKAYACRARECIVGGSVLKKEAWLWAEPGSAEEKGRSWEEAVPRIGE